MNYLNTQEKVQMTEAGGTVLPSGAPGSALRNVLRQWLVLPALVAFAAFVMQRSVALLGLDLHHDALMFDAARRLLNGELPFRDFFYQYNLGTVFFHALALKVLGVQIASLKIATAVVYSVIAVLVYACGAVTGKGRWVLVAALVWSTLSPFHMPTMNGYHAWSTVYMMAAVMGGALCLTIAITGPSLRWALLAGVLFNLAFWFKQVAGLPILAVLAWVAFNALRPSFGPDTQRRFRFVFFGIALGGLVSSIPFFVYLYQHSLFEDWWRSAFVFNGFFATSGHSVTGLIALARTFLPVTRELGYISVVWALLPLCLAAIVIERHTVGGTRLFSRSDNRSLVLSLFAVLSIAGWLEYFPLAHAFHTQLFMAPMFVLLSLYEEQGVSKSCFREKRRWPVIGLLMFTGVALVYEVSWHFSGLYEKIRAPKVVLVGEMPVGGLRLAPEDARSFSSFYDTMLAADKAAVDSQWIPMSVDPLRALLPDGGSVSADFKMGLNWTWPNEIVEPGFNKRVVMRIAERKAPIYADSLISIPGYIPIDLLEMRSPITASHTLYAPSADREVAEPPTKVVVDELLNVSIQAFPKAERAVIAPFDPLFYVSFLQIDDLESMRADDIVHLHVSVVRFADIPSSLSELQYEYLLKAIPDNRAARVAYLYERKRATRYELKQKLERGQMLDFAKFMLSQGKLFEVQDRPMYATTLATKASHRPFLAKMAADESELRLLWARSWPMRHVSMKAKSETAAVYFLAIPAGIVRADEEAVLYVQIVMQDDTTRNFYLHYLPS